MRLFALFLFLSVVVSERTACAGPSVPPKDLAHEIADKMDYVEEFQAIRQEAARRGLRVWMLGGAAASYGEHIKHSMLPGTIPGRTLFNFNAFLLPEQDVDLVVTRADGRKESAAEVNQLLDWVRNQYPYTSDGRSRWDAIGLKTDIPERHKMHLEGNPHFLEQNNDSLSLGMIELTTPPKGQSVVKDLSPRKQFLSDLAGNEFHYYAEPTHFRTPRFLDGTNPPILSAIRAIEKSVRYDKFLDDASIEEIRRIIQDWDPTRVDPNSYVGRYLEGRAKRVVTHAVNLEQAFRLLNKSGLRDKLLQLPWSDPDATESLAWWLNKKPLPSAPGTGGTIRGVTAGDLGIQRAYHWTNDSGHRLITWNYDGTPRLFESRQGYNGENAALGDGFYTFANDPAKLRQTQGKSNQLVEFRVNPLAEEGIDFTYDRLTNTVVWKNSHFLQVEQKYVPYPANMICSGLYTNFAVGSGVMPKNVNAALQQGNLNLAVQHVLNNAFPAHPLQAQAKMTAIELKKLGHYKLAKRVELEPDLINTPKVQKILSRGATGLTLPRMILGQIPDSIKWTAGLAGGGIAIANIMPAVSKRIMGRQATECIAHARDPSVKLDHACPPIDPKNVELLEAINKVYFDKGMPVTIDDLTKNVYFSTDAARACAWEYVKKDQLALQGERPRDCGLAH